MKSFSRFNLVRRRRDRYRFKNQLVQMTRLSPLTIMLMGLLIVTVGATPSYAKISGTLKGSYDYGDVNDGTAGGNKATNSGYSGEGTLSYIFAPTASTTVHLGGFYLLDSSKTQTTNSSSLQNFSISPTGYGIDVAVKMSSFFLHLGYGYFTASARKVVDGVGRDYSLTEGTGTHLGLGYILHTSGRLNFFVDTTYRQIVYKHLEIKSGDGMALSGDSQWNQKLLSLGGGILVLF